MLGMQGFCETHSFVRNDLNALNVPSSLKNLSEYLFRNPWIKATDIQCPLVRLWRSPADETPRACCRQNISRRWRSHRGWYGVVVLRYDDWR